ncbi:MAG TPA: hypothetical protein PLS56_01350 [Candidatus Dojkabacteria bacterium]|nr:hypothetical protein [Candidatus Dojkabacteria bacterium]
MKENFLFAMRYGSHLFTLIGKIEDGEIAPKGDFTHFGLQEATCDNPQAELENRQYSLPDGRKLEYDSGWNFRLAPSLEEKQAEFLQMADQME